MKNLKTDILQKLTEELVKATEARDEYEIKYELEKARMIMSAEIQAFSNQTMRDAQVTLLMEKHGMYRKMAELRSKAKLTWYKWSSIKSLIDGRMVQE